MPSPATKQRIRDVLEKSHGARTRFGLPGFNNVVPLNGKLEVSPHAQFVFDTLGDTISLLSDLEAEPDTWRRQMGEAQKVQELTDRMLANPMPPPSELEAAITQMLRAGDGQTLNFIRKLWEGWRQDRATVTDVFAPKDSPHAE